MPDILVVRCRAHIAPEHMNRILDNIKAQKETGVILLPHYLEAQVVPDDIEIKSIEYIKEKSDGNGKKYER